ncbi:MAG TPA: hypothetical protein DCQ30_00200 [Acidimicrobiaceae bacterium]|nr:hypothetical protein [Acidimicrobiaceae bacterium]
MVARRGGTWLAVMVVGALAMAACGAGPSAPGHGGEGSTAAPPTTSVPAPSAHCLATGLSGSVEGTQGAAGTIEITVQLRNVGTASCTIEGYPGLQLVDAGGTELRTSVIRGGSYRFTDLAAAPVTLPAQALAYVNVAYSDVPSGQGACEAAAALWVTPPDDVDHVVVTARSTVCGGTLTVSPFFGAGSPGTQTTAPPH